MMLYLIKKKCGEEITGICRQRQTRFMTDITMTEKRKECKQTMNSKKTKKKKNDREKCQCLTSELLEYNDIVKRGTE